MPAESFQCRLVSWKEAEELGRKLAYSIMDSGYLPEVVIAIGRGGFVPARVVCDYMMHQRLTSIRIEHWGIAARKMEKARVIFPLSIDIAGKDVLIIDDITDTGDTLGEAVEYIRSLCPENIRTGVLQHKTTSSIKPDYYPELITEWKWIIYPWALHEDLVGFTEKVISEAFETPGEIRKRLIEGYEIDTEEDRVRRAAEVLVRIGKAERSGGLFRKNNNESDRISDKI